MYAKLALSFLMLVFTSLNCSAQPQDQRGVRYHDLLSLPDIIMKVISSTRDGINAYFKGEDAAELNRKLRYFKDDLIDYLTVRQKLIQYIEKKNFDVPEKKKYIKTVENLKRDLMKLGARLDDLRPYVGEEVSRSAEKTIQQINQWSQDQDSLVLSPLGEFVEGKRVDKAAFRNNAAKLYNQLQLAVDEVSSIQDLLKSKFKL
jgi:hypothetical protein